MPRRGGVGGVPTKGTKWDVTIGGTQRNTRHVAVKGRGRPRGRGDAVSNGRSGMRRRRKVEIEDEDSEEEEEDGEGDDGDEPYIPAPNPRAPAKKRGGALKSTGRPRKQKKVVEDDEDDEEEQDDDNEENRRLPSLQSYSKKTISTSLFNTPAKSSETDEPTHDRAPAAPGPYKYPRPLTRPPLPRRNAPPSPRRATGYYVSRLPPLSYSPSLPTGDPRNYDPRNSEPTVVEESQDQEEEQVSQNSRNYFEAQSVLKPKIKHTLEDEFKLCAQNGKAYAEHVMGGVVVTGKRGEGIGVGNGATSGRRAKVGVRYREVNEDEDGKGEVGGDVNMEDIQEEEETRRDEEHIPIPSNTPHANINTNRPPTPPGTQTQAQNPPPPPHSTRSHSTPPPIPTTLHQQLSTEIARVTHLMNSPFSTLSAAERAERINRQTSHKKLVSSQNGVGFGLISPHDSWQHAIDLDDWICVEKIEVDGVDSGERREGVVRWRVWAEERVPRPVNARLRDPREIRGG